MTECCITVFWHRQGNNKIWCFIDLKVVEGHHGEWTFQSIIDVALMEITVKNSFNSSIFVGWFFEAVIIVKMVIIVTTSVQVLSTSDLSNYDNILCSMQMMQKCYLLAVFKKSHSFALKLISHLFDHSVTCNKSGSFCRGDNFHSMWPDLQKQIIIIVFLIVLLW